MSRINPATDEPLEPVAINAFVTDIVLGGDALWVGSSDGTITAFDALTGKRLGEIEIGGTPDALAYGADSLWALDALANEIIRVDPGTRSVVARIPLAGNLKDIAAGEGGVSDQAGPGLLRHRGRPRRRVDRGRRGRHPLPRRS